MRAAIGREEGSEPSEWIEATQHLIDIFFLRRQPSDEHDWDLHVDQDDRRGGNFRLVIPIALFHQLFLVGCRCSFMSISSSSFREEPQRLRNMLNYGARLDLAIFFLASAASQIRRRTSIAERGSRDRPAPWLVGKPSQVIEIEGGQRPVYVLELILLRYRSPRC